MSDLSLEAARHLDTSSEFIFPKDVFSLPQRSVSESEPVSGYLIGHSLGLCSRFSTERVLEVQESWRLRGVEGHFEGAHPWYPIHQEARPVLAQLTGGLETECVMMGSLTSNLHLMLAAFYQPDKERHLILRERGAFPSDEYALETHLRCRGLDPDTHILEVAPHPGEHLLGHDDIAQVIEDRGHEIKLIVLSAVQFVTGQALDIENLTKLAKSKGCIIGFDLAHAMGNIPLRLHEWAPDFAVFCGYKYLCAGAGNGAGIWVHERHATNPELTHLGGWWGNDPDSRFNMTPGFNPILRADRFAISNPPLHSIASALGGLDAYGEAASMNGNSFDAMWQRREQLWSFMHKLLAEIEIDLPNSFSIITPTAPGSHGSMIAIHVPGRAEAIEKALREEGFMVDSRGKHVVRISAVPLWVSAEQLFQLATSLRQIVKST